MRHVYLAATGQNRGKTTVSLGVLDGFQRRGLSTGFIKPVGQRTIIEDGVPADEDAVLMKSVFDLAEPLGQMSPVHIPRGFTQAYIEGQRRRGPRRRGSETPTPRSPRTATSSSSRAPAMPASARSSGCRTPLSRR